MRESVTRRYDLADPEATEALAAAIARALPRPPSGWLILLEGELGSGKSTLARAMLREFGHQGPVPSPTYTLVEPYSFSGFVVYHIDLYRVSDPEELEFLGWSDLEDGLRIVEWPERVPGLRAQGDLAIRLSYRGAGRRAEISGVSERGNRLLSLLAAGKES